MTTLPLDITKAMQGISKVSLRGGVVGKVSLTVIFVGASMAAVAWSAKSIWLSCAVVLGMFILSFVMLWRIIGFAERNPQAALLEGAEFLAYETLLQGAKGQPAIQVDPKDRALDDDSALLLEEQEASLVPDVEDLPKVRKGRPR